MFGLGSQEVVWGELADVIVLAAGGGRSMLPMCIEKGKWGALKRSP